MACDKRREKGTCSHHYCEFSYETDHGYECVDVVGGFCEVGEGCMEGCPYSFTGGEIGAAEEAFKTKYGE